MNVPGTGPATAISNCCVTRCPDTLEMESPHGGT
jgi:hypothetical protein